MIEPNKQQQGSMHLKEGLLKTIGVGLIIIMLVGCNDRRDVVRDADYFEITVADSKTREPIEGVLFLGYWDLYEVYGLHGYPVTGIAQTLEAVTDSAGKIRVPHPKTIPDYVPGGYFGVGDPSFALYKPGYKEKEYKNIGNTFHKPDSSIDKYLNNERNFNEDGFAIHGGRHAYWHRRTVYIERHPVGGPIYASDKPYEPDGIRNGVYHILRHWVKEQGRLSKHLPNTFSLLNKHYPYGDFESE